MEGYVLKDEGTMYKKRTRKFQIKIKLTDIAGSGKDGRILKEDVLAFMSDHDTRWLKTTIRKVPTAQVPPVVPPVVGVSLEDKKVPISGFVKVMARTMTASLVIPHFVYSDEIDVTNLIAIRSELKPLAESQGIKLTFLPFFVKAASMALSYFPIVNSSVDEKCENIIYKLKPF
ncbi:hypothetical protein J437_LFUL018107 [Ladona fulva]|uniref:Peripheral subunit-binding (PSBD) domain-containing protein n=1 Tax=Ladona fulva TaxID=123851 RepID=A0A8K0KV56_LADFU|nr:hypothetical protein J437_LFUL018107 [Ladona fulva]